MPLTRRFLMRPIYSIRRHSFLTCKTQSVIPSFPVALLSVHPRPEPLRAQRLGEQASGTRCPASRHLLGCAGDQVFGERHPRLLAGEIVFFHSGGIFMVDGRVRDCDYFVFFLVDVRGTATTLSSSCIDCGPLLQATHYVD